MLSLLLSENFDQKLKTADWPTGGLAALGFPNGAESGMGRRNLNDMEFLRVQAIVRVANSWTIAPKSASKK
jgi:hypothetical protein